MRARIKSFDDMPEEYKCCAETIRVMKPYLGTVTNIQQPVKFREYNCPFCGSQYAGMAYMEGTAILMVNMIDIDESAEMVA